MAGGGLLFLPAFLTGFFIVEESICHIKVLNRQSIFMQAQSFSGVAPGSLEGRCIVANG